MASRRPQPGALPSDDELDDILNNLANGRVNAETIQDDAAAPPPKQRVTGDDVNGLGIDEEIVITRKRAPVPKLDDHRLLSDAGIPRLRRISKVKLQFKGKGHEYRDIARMLNMYQLWLDDLYPRAKFADALAIVEKVGHTKRMQLMRKDWIDEGKPKRHTEQDEDQEVTSDDGGTGPETELRTDVMEGVEGNAYKKGNNSACTGSNGDMGDAASDADPDEDELDALLAESALPPAPISGLLPVRTANEDEDLFADEMEAMGEDW